MLIINTIEISNFKSIKNTVRIDFDKLNLVVGTNSSGKTSILQCILLLAQRKISDDFLNGNGISLGTLRNVKNFDSEVNEKMIISLNGGSKQISVSENEGRICLVQDDFSGKLLYGEDVYYLPAERMGIKDLYSVEIDKNAGQNMCESIISQLSKIENSKISINGFNIVDTDGLIEEFDQLFNEYFSQDLALRKETISELLNIWFESLTGYRYKIDAIPDSNYIQLHFYKNEMSSSLIRPQHVGTGVTYIFIQLAMGFVTCANSLILVENPELHLHPRLQSYIAHFYGWLSKNNRQVIIESHSDHVFNAFRIQNMTNNVAVNYCVQDILAGNVFPSTVVHKIEFGDYGVIKKAYEGLVDQFEIDLEKMLVLGDENIV